MTRHSATEPPLAPERPPSVAGGDHAPPPYRRGILALIAVAQLMVVLDTTIVNIALPSAQRDLGFSADSRQWVITAYALAFGSLLLLGGRLSDLLGRRRTLLIGLLGFAIASAVGGAATGFAMLVAARALQGAFAAILAPAALSTLNVTFTETKERARAFAVYAGVAGGGAVIGLILGGALTEWLSWRWCLYVNLAFAIPAAAGVLAWVRGRDAGQRLRIDLFGALTASGGLFCLVYALSNAELHGWGDSMTIALLSAAGLLLAAFALVEMRVRDPLLPMRVVADRNRGASYLGIAIAFCGVFGAFLFLTYFLQNNLGYSPMKTGVAFLPLAGGLMVAAGVSNTRLVPLVGPRPLVPIGMLAASGGMWWLSQLAPDSTYAGGVLGPMLVLGLGVGLIVAPSITTATAGVDSADAGVGSAMVNTSQQVGGAVGAAALSTVFSNGVADYLINHRPKPDQQPAALHAAAAISGYTAAFSVSAIIFLAGALVTVLLLRSGRIVAESDTAAAL